MGHAYSRAGTFDQDAAANYSISSLDEMANRLVHHLGVDGAIRACRENRWIGILSVILNRETEPA